MLHQENNMTDSRLIANKMWLTGSFIGMSSDKNFSIFLEINQFSLLRFTPIICESGALQEDRHRHDETGLYALAIKVTMMIITKLRERLRLLSLARNLVQVKIWIVINSSQLGIGVCEIENLIRFSLPDCLTIATCKIECGCWHKIKKSYVTVTWIWKRVFFIWKHTWLAVHELEGLLKWNRRRMERSLHCFFFGFSRNFTSRKFQKTPHYVIC